MTGGGLDEAAIAEVLRRAIRTGLREGWRDDFYSMDSIVDVVERHVRDALADQQTAQAEALARVEALANVWALGYANHSEYDNGRWHRAAAVQLRRALMGIDS